MLIIMYFKADGHGICYQITWPTLHTWEMEHFPEIEWEVFD